METSCFPDKVVPVIVYTPPSGSWIQTLLRCYSLGVRLRPTVPPETPRVPDWSRFTRLDTHFRCRVVGVTGGG